MRILGIESSCDDTSVALLDCSPHGLCVLAEKTASQIDIHKHYGGVVPEVAGREHAEHILPVVQAVLEQENKKTKKQKNNINVIDVIAVTSGPGLITGLVVGVETAKTLSYLTGIPLIGINHIEGHIHSVLINQKPRIAFPAVCLIVSGGHTELLLMKDFGEYELIGKTRDDAAGEAFDKVGKLLGFDYPGGPRMSKEAERGNPTAIDFPRPMLDQKNVSAQGGQALGLDFSFAGLKTAALYWLQKNSNIQNSKFKIQNSHDFCASFEQAIIDVLVTKTIRAAETYNAQTVILGGGVSANQKLRSALADALSENAPHAVPLTPPPGYSMDNGAMIAAAAYHHAQKKEFISWKDIAPNPNWKLYE